MVENKTQSEYQRSLAQLKLSLKQLPKGCGDDLRDLVRLDLINDQIIAARADVMVSQYAEQQSGSLDDAQKTFSKFETQYLQDNSLSNVPLTFGEKVERIEFAFNRLWTDFEKSAEFRKYYIRAAGGPPEVKKWVEAWKNLFKCPRKPHQSPLVEPLIEIEHRKTWVNISKVPYLVNLVNSHAETHPRPKKGFNPADDKAWERAFYDALHNKMTRYRSFQIKYNSKVRYPAGRPGSDEYKEKLNPEEDKFWTWVCSDTKLQTQLRGGKLSDEKQSELLNEKEIKMVTSEIIELESFGHKLIGEHKNRLSTVIRVTVQPSEWSAIERFRSTLKRDIGSQDLMSLQRHMTPLFVIKWKTEMQKHFIASAHGMTAEAAKDKSKSDWSWADTYVNNNNKNPSVQVRAKMCAKMIQFLYKYDIKNPGAGGWMEMLTG